MLIVLGSLFLAEGAQATTAPGDLVIREFRLRGPSSTADEYVVIHNRTATDITVAASDASAGFGVASSDGNLLFAIPNGTVIPARGHFLGVNSTGYSLGGGQDAAWTTDLGDGAGIGIFTSTTTFSAPNLLDAVGFTGGSAPFIEGVGLPVLSTNGEYAWIRKGPNGTVQDTNSNLGTGANTGDFTLIATDGAIYNGIQSILGAPSPTKSGTRDTYAGVSGSLIEPLVGVNLNPNRVHLTNAPGDRLEFRRRLTNNTGATLHALRLRFMVLATYWSPGYEVPTQADLRPSTSATVTLAPTSIGATTMQGLTLLTPPVQPIQGGLNSVLTLPGGLASGASIDINMALRVFRAGSYAYFATIETMDRSQPPVFSPLPGDFVGSITVQLTSGTQGAAIRYTLDGSSPDESSAIYSEPLLLTATTTVQAFASADGFLDSTVVSGTFTKQADGLAFSPSAGSYLGPLQVIPTTATPGALIHYTMNGDTPTESDPYVASGAAIVMPVSGTLKARAYASGYAPSPVQSGAYEIVTPTPGFTTPPGTYTSSVSVSIGAVPGAAVHYTTNGDEPTAGSTLYSAPFVLTGTATVKAKAFVTGWTASSAAAATYTINVADPVMNPAGGKWYTQHTISVTTATPGATMYYTTDGSEPTTGSTPVTGGGVLVSAPTLLRVKAFKPGAVTSSSVRGSYLITGQLAGGDLSSVILKTDGTVWTFGSDNYGGIGDGTPATQRLGPVQVVSLSDVIAIAAGQYSTYALKSDGTVWAWGYNASGQLGNGTTADAFSPVQVTGLTNVTAIAAGGSHALALLSDGTVRSWGLGTSGQLGRNSPTSSSSPVTVTGLSDVKSLAVGASHSLALKNNGAIVAWGAGLVGQIGDGAGVQRLLPVTLPTLVATDIASKGDASYAILAAGRTLVSWGSNVHAHLGDGSTTNRLSPVTIRAGVRELAPGLGHLSFSAFDARLWGVGHNSFRQLGDGTQSMRHVPIRSVLTRSVVSLGSGSWYTLAGVASGEVWAMGANQYGTLGLGNTAAPILPIIIPSFSLFNGTGLDADLDGDGLDLYEEVLLGTDPLLVDSNGNGLADGDEFAIGSEGGDPDPDHDGLSNEAELLAGTNPFVADSDGDGALDGADAFPLDPTKAQLTAQPGDTTPPVITLVRPTSATPIP